MRTKTEIPVGERFKHILLKIELKERLDKKIESMGIDLSYSALIKYLLDTDEKFKKNR